jgi:hypothetical protein
LDISQFRQKIIKRAVPFIIAILPAGILALNFVFRMASRGEGKAMNLTLGRRILSFRPYYILVSFDKRELLLSVLLMTLFLLLLFQFAAHRIKPRHLERRDGMLIIFLASIVIYLITPDNLLGGGRSLDRITLYTFILLGFLFATIPYGSRIKRAVIAAGSLITLAFLVAFSVKYVELNRYLREYLSGMPMIEKNSALLPLSFAHRGSDPAGKNVSMRIRPFLHASGYIAAERGIVDFSNYSATMKYFPLRFHPNLDPYVHIGNIDSERIEKIDFLSYPERTGGSVDYVLIWGLDEGMAKDKDIEFIKGQLEDRYEFIYESDSKLMKLYRRRPGAGISQR